jgi:hypothetical protein
LYPSLFWQEVVCEPVQHALFPHFVM